MRKSTSNKLKVIGLVPFAAFIISTGLTERTIFHIPQLSSCTSLLWNRQFIDRKYLIYVFLMGFRLEPSYVSFYRTQSPGALSSWAPHLVLR